MPDDYSELLDGYDFSKAVRGKYHEKYLRSQGKIPVKITSNDGDRYVTLRTVKVEALVTPDGKLTVQLDGDITPGEYRVTLIIEEPATQNIEHEVHQMSETMNLEKAVLDNLRILPNEKQQEVLDFVEFIVQKARQLKQVSSEVSDSSISSTTQEKKQLSLQEIARLTIEERHKLLAPYIAATTEDFLNDPELTEFSILDGEDWETEND
jgi:hypothetical protein